MFEALKARRSLSPEHKALLETKQLAGEYEPGALVALLAPIAVYDQSCLPDPLIVAAGRPSNSFTRTWKVSTTVNARFS